MADADAPAAASERPAPLTFQEWAELAGFRLAQAMILWMPPLMRFRFAERVGRFLGPRLGLARRIAGNLDRVRPDLDADARRRVTAGVMGGFTRTAIEYTAMHALYGAAPQWTVEGREHLQAAKAAAGGRLVLASAHLGNWEAVRAIAALEGAPLAIIYRAFNNRAIDETCYRYITAMGAPAFRKGKEGARELFRHVRGGAGAMILVDQRLGGAPLVDFMGQPAETSLAAAQLALTLKAPLLPAVAFRDGDGFRVRFEPPVPTGAPKDMMAEVNRVIGEWVDEAPEQWFWLHRRWRIRKEADKRRKQSAANATEDDGS